MKKLLIAVLSIILILSSSVAIYAAEDNEAISNGEKSDTGASDNPFDELYAIIYQNMDKIFSALTLIASLILMFAYKKGALPLIKSGILGLGKTAGELADKTGAAIEKTEETLSFLSDRFAFCESSVESVAKSIEELDVKLQSMETEKKNAEKTKVVLLSQIDLLYEIFMQSSLPQYAKDSVGEKVAEMKKSLSAGEENG